MFKYSSMGIPEPAHFQALQAAVQLRKVPQPAKDFVAIQDLQGSPGPL